jgi:low temperature requirement protein LtrA
MTGVATEPEVNRHPRAPLRPPERAREVEPVELFFDLVYVLAVTQVTHHLLEHLDLRGAVQTAILLLTVWATWINTAWITNYFDMTARPARVVLLILMLASLLMSASIPEAFDDRGLAFVAGIIAIGAGGPVMLMAAMDETLPLRLVLRRVVTWWLLLGIIWVAGALVDGDLRIAIWAVSMTGFYVLAWTGFPLPYLGHSHTTDYTIAGPHLAHRCLLFITLALGESILITGTNFGELPSSAERVAAFVVAFAGSLALWWIYFDRAEEAALEVMADAQDPGWFGLIAYTYVHVLIVGGIIVTAAGDELAIAHPGDDVTVESAALILGGPALYIVGHGLFKLAVWDVLSVPRIVALAALAALIPLAFVASSLVLLTAATLVLVAVVVWDTTAGSRHAATVSPRAVRSAPPH